MSAHIAHAQGELHRLGAGLQSVLRFAVHHLCLLGALSVTQYCLGGIGQHTGKAAGKICADFILFQKLVHSLGCAMSVLPPTAEGFPKRRSIFLVGKSELGSELQ